MRGERGEEKGGNRRERGEVEWGEGRRREGRVRERR